MGLLNIGIFVCCIAMAMAQEPMDIYGHTLSILGNTEYNMRRSYFEVRQNLTKELFYESPEYNGKIYWLSKTGGRSRDVAELTCKYFGGYLVEINDNAEYLYLSNWLDNYKDNPVTSILIGISDEAIEGQFVYRYSGIPATFFKWDNGQTNQPPGIPNYSRPEPNGNIAENCVQLDYKRGGWKMYDVSCYDAQYWKLFLCEMEPQNFCY